MERKETDLSFKKKLYFGQINVYVHDFQVKILRRLHIGSL